MMADQQEIEGGVTAAEVNQNDEEEYRESDNDTQEQEVELSEHDENNNEDELEPELMRLHEHEELIAYPQDSTAAALGTSPTLIKDQENTTTAANVAAAADHKDDVDQEHAEDRNTDDDLKADGENLDSAGDIVGEEISEVCTTDNAVNTSEVAVDSPAVEGSEDLVRSTSAIAEALQEAQGDFEPVSDGVQAPDIDDILNPEDTTVQMETSSLDNDLDQEMAKGQPIFEESTEGGEDAGDMVVSGNDNESELGSINEQTARHESDHDGLVYYDLGNFNSAGAEDAGGVEDKISASRATSRSRRRSVKSGISEESIGEENNREEGRRDRPTRAELLERYQQALSNRHQLQQHNSTLQHRLSDCLRRKKVDDLQFDDRTALEHEQRYLKYMAALDDLRREEREFSEEYHRRLATMEGVVAVKHANIEGQCNSLEQSIRTLALSAPSAATGKPLPQKVVDELLEVCRRREAEVSKVRLQNIKLKNQLDKHMSTLRSQEELGEGLHMIDFEQLKIENQTYNEKIEERNEELLRLKKKITATVEVLSHVKEKLQFVETQNERDRVRLQELEQQTSAKRDEVSHLKKVRDTIRKDNVKLRQAAGLLTNHALLADYEHKVNECNAMTHHLQELKRRSRDIGRVLSGGNSAPTWGIY